MRAALAPLMSSDLSTWRTPENVLALVRDVYYGEVAVDRRTALIVDRFWSYVARGRRDECWTWLRGLDKDGYGKFQWGPRGAQVHVKAHRLALALATRKDGEVAMHSCDTPSCCNPDHLRWGSQAENRADCVSKGRHAKGATHGSVSHPESVPRGENHYKIKRRLVRRPWVPRGVDIHAARGTGNVPEGRGLRGHGHDSRR